MLVMALRGGIVQKMSAQRRNFGVTARSEVGDAATDPDKVEYSDRGWLL